LNQDLHEILNRALQKGKYASLKAFYHAHSFSFSYEYLRKIFSGERIPLPKGIGEIAKALGLDPQQLGRQAADSRLAHQVRRHYRLPPNSQLGRFSEKLRRLQHEGRADVKILKMVQRLGPREKDQLIEYLKFLRQQGRRKTRGAKK